MILLNPEGSSQEGRAPWRRDPATSTARRIGLLGNSKLNADAVLYAIGELLAQRYAVKTWSTARSPTSRCRPPRRPATSWRRTATSSSPG